MSETTKRVNVTLTLATDLNPSVVLAGITERMGGQVGDLIVGTSAHAFDLNDDDQDPQAQLVISHDGSFGGIQAAYVDQPERAAEHAKNIRGVVVELPIGDDFRAEDSGR